MVVVTNPATTGLAMTVIHWSIRPPLLLPAEARAKLIMGAARVSAVISEQDQALTFTLKNGDEVTGRLIEDAADHYVVLIDPLNGTRKELTKAEVGTRVASKVSPMPEGLINVLEKDEVLDLLAYLESNGKSDAPLFKR